MQTIGLMVAFARVAPDSFGEALEQWEEDDDERPVLALVGDDGA